MRLGAIRLSKTNQVPSLSSDHLKKAHVGTSFFLNSMEQPNCRKKINDTSSPSTNDMSSGLSRIWLLVTPLYSPLKKE